MTDSTEPALRGGLAYGLAAFIAWGLMPLYFKSVTHVAAYEVLACRVVATVLLLAGVLSVFGLWSAVARGLADPSVRNRLLLSSGLIAFNWFTYIWGVTHNRIAETALGYYLLPLVNVGIGMLLFDERLDTWQRLALCLAAAGVAVEVIATMGETIPWIALTLAVSFAAYGLIRKTAAIDGLSGLMVETTLLSPLAITYLLLQASAGGLALGHFSLQTDLLLAFSAVVTAVPLVCFAQAARRLPMTTMGFLQYISPTMQLILGVAVYGEEFPLRRQLSFALIWAGLLIYTLHASARARQRAALTASR